jgi:hypothetical protein
LDGFLKKHVQKYYATPKSPRDSSITPQLCLLFLQLGPAFGFRQMLSALLLVKNWQQCSKAFFRGIEKD